MTTKIQLVEEAKNEINKHTLELESLKEQHRLFTLEDEQHERLETEKDKLCQTRRKLLEKMYIGNWDNRSNWYESEIPKEFLHLCGKDHERRDIIMEILTEIAKEKEQEIKASSEFIDIENRIEALNRIKIKSKAHEEIEKKISTAKESIEYWNNRLTALDDRGQFIQICKDYKQNEERKKKLYMEKLQKEELKKRILEVINK